MNVLHRFLRSAVVRDASSISSKSVWGVVIMYNVCVYVVMYKCARMRGVVNEISSLKLH